MEMCVAGTRITQEGVDSMETKNQDELQLTGKFKDKEGLLTGLRKYLRQVFIINPKAEFNRSEISKIEDIPFDMQTLILCE